MEQLQLDFTPPEENTPAQMQARFEAALALSIFPTTNEAAKMDILTPSYLCISSANLSMRNGR